MNECAVEALLSDSIHHQKYIVYLKQFCLDLKHVHVHFFVSLLTYVVKAGSLRMELLSRVPLCLFYSNHTIISLFVIPVLVSNRKARI